MRPIQLEIEGLATIRAPQTLDFASLEDIFAITGPTGAGKSSVLDAMTFALYGTMARADKAKGSAADFLSLGAKRMMVVFTFEHRTATVRITRVLSVTGKSKSQKISFERLASDGSWHSMVPHDRDSKTEVDEAIVSFIGMEFQSFVRTVFLPQGQFSDFLRGDAASRRLVLQGLCDTTAITRAAVAARQKSSELSVILLDLNARQKTLRDAVLSEDAARALSDTRGRWINTAETLDRVLGIFPTHLADLRALTQRHDDTLTHQRRLDAVYTQMQRWELDGRSGESSYRQAQDSVATATTHLESSLATQQEATTEAAFAHVTWEHLEPAVRLLDQIESAQQHLERAVTAQRQNPSACTDAEMAALTLGVAAAEQRVLSAEADVQKAMNELEAAALQTQMASAWVQLTAEREKFHQQRDDAQRALTSAQQGMATLEAAAALAQQQFGDAMTHQHRDALLATWESGEPCPLCGTAAAHPVGGDGAAARDLAHLREDSERARQAVTQARPGLIRFHGRLDAAEQSLAQLSEREEVLRRDGALHANLAAEEEVRSQIRSCQLVVRETRTVEKESLDALQQAQQHSALAQQAAETGARALTDVTSARDALSAWIASYTLEFAAEREPTVKRPTARHPEVESAHKTAVADEAAAAHKTATTLGNGRLTIETLKDVLTAAKSRRAAATSRLTEAQRQTKERQLGQQEAVQQAATAAQIVAGHEARGVAHLSSLVADRTATGEWDAWLSTRASSLTNQLAELDAAITELRELMRALDAEARSNVPEDMLWSDPRTDAEWLRSLQTLQRTAREEGDALDASLASSLRASSALTQENGAAAATETLQHRYDRLGKILRTDAFIDYVLAEGFGDVVSAASDEIWDLSQGRFRLGAGAKNEFLVIDVAAGSVPRAVHTLSGGETFLASLALSLGLARTVMSQGTVGTMLEFLIIDEGFESLDRTSLDEVLAALERLQQRGHMIGVVTHVREMYERITSGFAVEPGVGGSTIVDRALQLEEAA